MSNVTPFKDPNPKPDPKKRIKTGGRTRGTPNKYKEVKNDMLWAYKRMGGKKALLKWAIEHKDSQEVFYKELLRLLPKELDLETNTGNIKLVMDLGGGVNWDDAGEDLKVSGE